MQARRTAGLILYAPAYVHTAPWPRPHPPALLPAPSPAHHCWCWCLSHARNAEQWGAPALRGGPTGRAKVLLASTMHLDAPCPASHAPALVTSTPPEANRAPNHTRVACEEAQCGTRGSGALGPSALLVKPRPPAESPPTAILGVDYKTFACACLRPQEELGRQRAQVAELQADLAREQVPQVFGRVGCVAPAFTCLLPMAAGWAYQHIAQQASKLPLSSRPRSPADRPAAPRLPLLPRQWAMDWPPTWKFSWSSFHA